MRRPLLAALALGLALLTPQHGRADDDAPGWHHRHHHATPPPTATVTVTNTATATSTATATGTSTATRTVAPSATHAPVLTSTPTATITSTAVIAPTTVPLATRTPTIAPTTTRTAAPAATSVPATVVMATATRTAVPSATQGATVVPVATSTGTAVPTVGRGRTVFIIVEENRNWSEFAGNTSAPYINGTLLPQASYATQYFNPPGNHPSLPNYMWLESGTNFGITDDGPPSSHPLGGAHLTSLLDAAHVSWTGYMDGVSGSGCPTSDSYPYAVKHDPFVYYTDTSGNAAYCQAHVRPYGELATALAGGTVARYVFITPNLCNDGHDSCGPLNNPIAQTDAWLKSNVPAILGSSAYKNSGALFVTWDEGSGGSDGPIGLIALSPQAKGSGYHNSVHYTHSSLLRTTEEMLGVSPLLGDAANATDLSDLFTTFP